MADKKISQLTASTTPLAGTEELAVVQSGVTKKVSVANLTAGRAVDTGALTATVGDNGGVSIKQNGVSQTGFLNFQASDGTLAGRVKYDHFNNSLQLFTDQQERVRVASNGDTTLQTGNLVIGTDGKGIDFSANTSAAGMTSELLDWYEEGAWTPSVGGNATYTGQLGKYTRIGRAVHIQMDLTINVLGTGSATTVSGLPFTANDYYALSTGFFFGIANNVVFISPVVQSGATDFVFYTLTAAGASTGTGTAVLGDGARIQITGTYFV